MSAALYRIDVERDLTLSSWPYSATVRQISDETIIAVRHAETPQEAELLGRELVRAIEDDPFTAYSVTVDSDGNSSTPTPESMRVAS